MNAYEKHIESYRAALPACPENQHQGRIIATDRGMYRVLFNSNEYSASLSGKFLFLSDSSEDFPCTGDFVCLELSEDGNSARIQGIIERKTLLKRKTPGKKIEYQLIGANIDMAFILQGCGYDFNINRLERYLVMVKDAGMNAVLVLTKIDLIDSAALEKMIQTVHESGIDIPVLALSNLTGSGFEKIRDMLLTDHTYCLIGSSGVGKTTLLNRLSGDELFSTNAVSFTGEGKHTTVRRQLVRLENGAWLLDTPGMRELGMLLSGTGLGESFLDILQVSEKCRFKNCTHAKEPGCAVQEAVQSGQIKQKHLENYLKLKRESEYNEMAYYEKRKKDRDFGKFVKSVTKEKKRR